MGPPSAVPSGAASSPVSATEVKSRRLRWGMESARELLLAAQRCARQRATALEREFAGLAEAASSAGTDDEHDPEGATLAFERRPR